MFVGTALSVRLLVYAGLSLFIISGPYLYVVVCVLYAYNLTKTDSELILHVGFLLFKMVCFPIDCQYTCNY